MLFFLACIPGWLTISKGISTPFDELAHFDYADKLAHLEMPKVNEPYGQRTLGMVACLPESGEAWAAVGPCGTEFIEPSKAPFDGQSSATPYAPTYYALLVPGYKACTSLTNIADLQCMQLSNSLLAGLSAVFLYLTLVIVGFRKITAFFAAAISVSSPAMIQQFATVNNDAGAHFGSTLLVLATVKLCQVRSNGDNSEQKSKCASFMAQLDRSIIFFVFILTSALVISIKETIILLLPLVIALLVMTEYRSGSPHNSPKIINAVTKRFPQRAREWIVGIFLFIGVLGVSALIRVMQPSLRGVGGINYMNEDLKGDGKFDITVLLTPLNHLFSSGSQIFWPLFSHPLAVTLSDLLSYLFFIGLLAWQAVDYHHRVVCPPVFTEERRSPVTTSATKMSSTGCGDLQRIFLQALTIGIFLFPVMAVIMGVLSRIQAGYIVSQPRYYMPISLVLGAISIGLVLRRANLLVHCILLTTLSAVFLIIYT